jgi:hypothetical protein
MFYEGEDDEVTDEEGSATESKKIEPKLNDSH